MLQKRGAGVLMHVTSLPSRYGIGVMDENCLHFIDALREMKFGYWQVLPFGPVDDVGSPYCSSSAFAGNLLLIDPQGLSQMGLCTEWEIEENVYSGTPYLADFAFAREKRMKLLRAAFARRGTAVSAAVEAFSASHPWLSDYALFMAAKEQNGGAPWWEWDASMRDARRCAAEHGEALEAEASFWRFAQYIFDLQWEKIKAYANRNGIAVIGDMPIYLARDSADVWANPSLFKLDPTTFAPTEVAGVPPDAFSAEGQLWGNPLYDWAAMERDGYAFWIHRLEAALDRFDAVRIDHFRAFASYYAIPAASESAKNGRWRKGPGMKLFRTLFAAHPAAPILAEDLGTFGADVAALLKKTGFPGMRVMQFGFDPDGDSAHAPHRIGENTVAYIGTHDNDTALGFLYSADARTRDYVLRYIGFEGDAWGVGGAYAPAVRRLMETLWRTAANTVIVSLQDLCGFGTDTRMNTPGTPEGNWRFRTTAEFLNGIDRAYFASLNETYRRSYPVFDQTEEKDK